MNKNLKSYGLILIGVILIGTGIVLLRGGIPEQGALLALPYICIGIGCGVLGHGGGELIGRAKEKRDPDTVKMIQIEQNDERNTAVMRRAKAKALDVMIFVFGALILALALLGADIYVVLLSTGAYVFVLGSVVYYSIRYNKEM